MNHADRRRRLAAEIGNGLILVRGEAGPGGPSPNFFYVTGLREPRAALLIAPQGVRIGQGRESPGPDYQRGRKVEQVLFLPPSDPLAASWGEDSKASLAAVRPQDAAVDAVLPAGSLPLVLDRVLPGAGTLHYVRSTAASLLGGEDPDTRFVGRIRSRFFGLELRDATAAVHEMRRIKDAGEIDRVRRAIDLTATALYRVWSGVRPGRHEYELEAEITGVYRSSDASHAFEPIVAAGPNAVLPHYKDNAARLEAGQLLLIDTGASVEGYKSDVTRTVPVDGRFTERQREVYETVLRAQIEAIAACKPGGTLGDVHARAYEVIHDAGFGEAFIHGTSHYLGLETHDVGDTNRPLSEGAVLTVEPGIYLPAEGIGVRIEDDVLVGADGPQVLTEAIPKSVQGIEERVGRA